MPSVLSSFVLPAACAHRSGASRRIAQDTLRALATLLALVCLVLLGSTPALAAPPGIRIVLAGKLTDKQKDNILSNLSLERMPKDRKISELTLQRLYAKISEEAVTAMEPFGYYEALAETTLQKTEEGQQITVTVTPGPPVTVRELEILVAGAGREDPAIQEAIAAFPLQDGDVLNHSVYESGKDDLITAALSAGYNKAFINSARVSVYRDDLRADLRLSLETGPQYTIGPITFETDSLDHKLLHTMLPVREGEPFSPRNLTLIRQTLFNANYFDHVELTYNLDQVTTEPHAVPITVALTPSATHQYGVGVGYGTDTGVRGTLEYTDRLVNSRGHQFALQLRPSQRKSTAATTYIIPLGNPRRDRMTLGGQYTSESFDETDIESLDLATTRDWIRDTWDLSVFLRYLDEDYEVGSSDSGHDRFLIPGVKGTVFWTDDRVSTNRGIRLNAMVQGGNTGALSDADFLQTTLRGKGIYRLNEQWRLIGRADLGATMVDNTQDIPPSLRFYAGGDQSVRGYGYKAIGPKDAEGRVLGGRHLLLYSMEMERALSGSWSMAAFCDSGTATNSFSDLDMHSGAGLGVRWSGAFGQLRVDVAKPIDSDGSWRIHLSLGADL
ncbi:MAG: autotransporter assembly complex protein TamA [Desulfobulbus sp.]|jgi:translocation and assembly module TamA